MDDECKKDNTVGVAGKLAIVVVLVVAVGFVVYLKQHKKHERVNLGPTENTSAQNRPATGNASKQVNSGKPEPKAALPRLLDLGASQCIPCKMMEPILEELKKEYSGKLTVEFIDVWKTPEAKERYDIELIPTQIFYDASGKELFRHQGFFSKQDILNKWKELGINLEKENSK